MRTSDRLRSSLHAAAVAVATLACAAPAHAAGEGHGPPWTSMGLHTFNLLLLLGILAWFAGPRVREAMKTRAADVKRDIDESNRLRKESREAFEQLESRLAGFEQQLAQMKAQADREAAEEREAILARAETDSKRLQDAAERTIRGETAKARMALRTEAVHLAVRLAEQRLAGSVGADDDRRLGEDFFTAVDRDDDNALQTEVPRG